jgi:hypothetical protein
MPPSRCSVGWGYAVCPGFRFREQRDSEMKQLGRERSDQDRKKGWVNQGPSEDHIRSGLGCLLPRPLSISSRAWYCPRNLSDCDGHLAYKPASVPKPTLRASRLLSNRGDKRWEEETRRGTARLRLALETASQVINQVKVVGEKEKKADVICCCGGLC